MTTWADLNTEFDTLLQSQKALYPEALRQKAFNIALRYFANTHTALRKRETVTLVASDVLWLVQFGIDPNFTTWPANALDDEVGPYGLAHADGWLEPQLLVPGQAFPTDGFTVTADGLLVWNTDGLISPVVWYYAYYNEMSDATSVYNGPLWALDALKMLALAHMLHPSMMSQENLRSYQDRRMAGDPKDNPPREQANFYINLYIKMVERVQPQERWIQFRRGPG